MRSFYNDERVIKTKKLIKTALSELIQEKGFDHVSITDLTQRANINRGTFYLHYQDKYDLLEKFENEVLDDINKNAENHIKSIKDIDFLGEDFSNEIKPFINKVFTYIKENYIIMIFLVLHLQFMHILFILKVQIISVQLLIGMMVQVDQAEEV